MADQQKLSKIQQAMLLEMHKLGLQDAKSTHAGSGAMQTLWSLVRRDLVRVSDRHFYLTEAGEEAARVAKAPKAPQRPVKAPACLRCEKPAKLPEEGGKPRFCSLRCGYEWAVAISSEDGGELERLWCSAHARWDGAVGCPTCNREERARWDYCPGHGLRHLKEEGCGECAAMGTEKAGGAL